jgi:hypothetical protein
LALFSRSPSNNGNNGGNEELFDRQTIRPGRASGWREEKEEEDNGGETLLRGLDNGVTRGRDMHLQACAPLLLHLEACQQLVDPLFSTSLQTKPLKRP